MALAHEERAVLVEHGVQAGRARAALQPQQNGRGVRTGRRREEPEEQVGIVPVVHGQVTGIALDGRFYGGHLGRDTGLVDQPVPDHGRQVQGAVVVGRRADDRGQQQRQ